MRLLIIAATLVAIANGQDGSCPVVEPVREFKMSRFLGKWNVMQETSLTGKCVSISLSRGNERGEYVLTHRSVDEYATRRKYKHHTDKLFTPYVSIPANMQINYSAGGSGSFIVFANNYIDYAGIFSCQNNGLQHVWILARRNNFEQDDVDILHKKLSSFGIDVSNLKNVTQSNCPFEDDY